MKYREAGSVCASFYPGESGAHSAVSYMHTQHRHIGQQQGTKRTKRGAAGHAAKGHGSKALWPHDLSMAIHAKFIRRHSARGRKPPEALVQARTQSFIYTGDTASVKLKVGKSFHGVLSSLQ